MNLRDVQQVGHALPCSHDSTVDQQTNYVTRSVLAVPLMDPDGEVVGVLQLVNCTDVRGRTVPFPAAQVAMVSSLANHAAIALRYISRSPR